MMTTLGHLALTVEDMEASLQFYCDVLGCEKAFEIHDKAGNPWIVYVKIPDGRFIELFYGGKVKLARDSHRVGFAHLCFEVDDIAQTADMLRSKGVVLDVEIQQGLDHNLQCWTHDPDGNPIEFMQIHPDSPQARARRALEVK
ncbi:VOC family protein [Alicyclobacillus fodiniaquatilis]|uniref:VOC family protein n=1 Tax=Alicyclobacillus fodiniaquatilis TaxID=1661150 RepID=A0ABW4JN67_9BACL